MELPDYSLYRALVFSNLLTVYQKYYIGKLSAFCGAVSASCAAGAAITYMVGEVFPRSKDYRKYSGEHSGNHLRWSKDLLCCQDRGQSGCGVSCSSSCHERSVLCSLHGILQEETAETISCVGQIGKDGMKETDREILKIMLEH